MHSTEVHRQLAPERIIGVDFDNTLVTYDDLFYAVALQRNLVPSTIEKDKKSIRDYLRRLPRGETEWQRLQAVVYGPRIGEASLIGGVETFFERCKREKARVYIISHKTEIVRHYDEQINLRSAALGWMTANGFFQVEGLGLSPESVFFCATRQEKVEQIHRLSCTHFIDDLEETFLENNFPLRVKKILFSPRQTNFDQPGLKIASTWQEINEYLFPQHDGHAN